MSEQQAAATGNYKAMGRLQEERPSWAAPASSQDAVRFHLWWDPMSPRLQLRTVFSFITTQNVCSPGTVQTSVRGTPCLRVCVCVCVRACAHTRSDGSGSHDPALQINLSRYLKFMGPQCWPSSQSATDVQWCSLRTLIKIEEVISSSNFL